MCVRYTKQRNARNNLKISCRSICFMFVCIGFAHFAFRSVYKKPRFCYEWLGWELNTTVNTVRTMHRIFLVAPCTNNIKYFVFKLMHSII